MKVLILHLSDIHIRKKDEIVFQRKNSIVDAIKNIEYRLDLAFIVVTGDLSFNADEEQIMSGMIYLTELKGLLEEKLSHKIEDKHIPTYLVVIPGNHDCYLNEKVMARDIIIKGILENPSVADDVSVINQCISVQSKFLEARDAFANEGINKNDSDIYYEYKYNINGEAILFRCLNTAWMSTINEQQGNIIYPENKIKSNRDNEAIVISLLHHPYNWLEATNARNLRRMIESTADIILTGHEHDAEYRKVEKAEGEKNTYIEGGVLNNKKSDESTFNLLVIDTCNKKQKYINYRWKEDKYIPTSKSVFCSDGMTPEWHDYQVNSLRFHEQFIPNKNMIEYLEEPGATFTRDKETIKLSEFYIFPDLKTIPAIGENKHQYINGDDISTFIKDNHYIMFLGDYQSGKTAFSKALFQLIISNGDIPILIDGANINDKNVEAVIEEEFVRQYDRGLLEAYRQADRSKRIIIIDDYNKTKLRHKNKKQFIASLCDCVGSVYLIADDLEMNIQDLTHPDNISGGGKSFLYCQIQPFSHFRRDLLIQKWLSKNEELRKETTEFARRLENTSRILNTLIGKNYVPAYPVYIITILFAQDASAAIDLSASTHAYFYELIIKIVIARGRTGFEYDIVASYLAFLAYNMFKRRKSYLVESEYKDLHREFEQKYEIDRPYEKMKQQLIDQHILVEHDGDYKYKHNFMYYYFVASYLRDNLNKSSDVQNDIELICSALYVEEFANILLFLAHLSKDPFIISQTVKRATSIFADLPDARLDSDVAFLGNLNKTIEELTIEELDKKDVRGDILKERDRQEEYENGSQYLCRCTEPVGEEEYKKNPLLQLLSSIKTIEILGQILKNFPGSIDAEDKYKIAKNCYCLGLRTLTFTFNIIKNNEEHLLKDFKQVIQEKHPEFDKHKIDESAVQSVVWLSELFAFAMIKRISYSVGTPELFTTYDKLLKEMQYPSVRLIDCSLHIDQAPYFPDKKIMDIYKENKNMWFPIEILRQLVIQHLYLFDVPYEKKQKVCEMLSIKYKNFQAINPKRKLIESKTR